MRNGATDDRPAVPFTNHLVFKRVMRDPVTAKGLLYVIFLCSDDPFGRERPRYTFATTCEEAEGLMLETGSHWMVLNAADYANERDEGVRSLLQYVATEEVAPDDPLVSRIDERVRVLNHDEELMEMASMLMTFEEDAIARGMLRGRREGRVEGRAEGRAEGLAEGEAQGEERYAELAAALAKAGRIDDIERAASDKAYRKQLLQEYGLS